MQLTTTSTTTTTTTTSTTTLPGTKVDRYLSSHLCPDASIADLSLPASIGWVALSFLVVRRMSCNGDIET